MMTAINRFEELCYRFEQSCHSTNNQRENIRLNSLEYSSISAANFRFAFAKMSKEIDFQCSDSIVKTERGFINKDMGCRTSDYLYRVPNIHWYLPENYTDELREENIEICLNANLGKIKWNFMDQISWLYYIDAIQDLLYLPSDAYLELSENWMLQLIDLATPGSLVCIRLKDRLRSSKRNKLRRPHRIHRMHVLTYSYAIDFKNHRFGIM